MIHYILPGGKTQPVLSCKHNTLDAFWIIGSQIFHLMRGVQGFLTGRVALLYMSPTSQREITGTPSEPLIIGMEALLAQWDQVQLITHHAGVV